MTITVLLLKIFVLIAGYFLLMGILTSLLASMGGILKGKVFLALLTGIYIYLYSFWGAYYTAIIDAYSGVYKSSWWILILCILSGSLWIKMINRELVKERQYMNVSASTLSIEGIAAANKLSIVVISLSLSFFILVSLGIFYFSSLNYDRIFFTLPSYFAKLFI